MLLAENDGQSLEPDEIGNSRRDEKCCSLACPAARRMPMLMRMRMRRIIVKQKIWEGGRLHFRNMLLYCFAHAVEELRATDPCLSRVPLRPLVTPTRTPTWQAVCLCATPLLNNPFAGNALRASVHRHIDTTGPAETFRPCGYDTSSPHRNPLMCCD